MQQVVIETHGMRKIEKVTPEGDKPFYAISGSCNTFTTLANARRRAKRLAMYDKQREERSCDTATASHPTRW